MISGQFTTPVKGTEIRAAPIFCRTDIKSQWPWAMFLSIFWR